jgi:putative peptide zinc metalloprotease protein
MSQKLFSDSWYRVAQLKVGLRPHAKLYRHLYRGEVWYLLQDPVSGLVHRFTPSARLIIAAMNGQRSMDELWELGNRHLADDAPTQDDIVNLVGQLYAADLVTMDITPEAAELFERGEQKRLSLRRRSYINPMGIRVPMFDPDRMLNRLEKYLTPLWTRTGMVLWLMLVLPALLALPLYWPQLTNGLSDRVLGFDNLLLLWFVFPILKVLHELGHATAVKAGGGEVHDMGIMLLVLMPVPYVEASAATVFRSKYQRAVVGAAGMMVELLIAALAFYLWIILEPGILRAVAFNIILVASVSTVIFNGNPLLRYDAYYILADLIEMPNLATRSLKYWGYLFTRYLFRARDVEPVIASRSEKAWYIFYGMGSVLYRIFVTISIALFIAGQYFFVGVLLAIWAIVMMAGLPLFKGLKYIFTSPKLYGRHGFAVSVTTLVVALVAVLLFVVPVPFRSQIEGVVLLSEQARVRAGGPGFVEEFLVEPGSQVRLGDALIRSSDLELDLLIATSVARVDELNAHYALAFVEDTAMAELVREQLSTEKARLARARQRESALLATAKTDGVFMVPRASDVPGRYYRKGDLIGYVLDDQRLVAKVAVPQGEVDVVSLATDRVAIRMVHDQRQVIPGRIIGQTPEGDERLPSLVLSSEGGGKLALDPTDPEGRKTLDRVFIFDVELDSNPQSYFFGERVFVRFDHEMKPLAVQWFRGIRRLFLSRFSF